MTETVLHLKNYSPKHNTWASLKTAQSSIEKNNNERKISWFQNEQLCIHVEM